MAPRNAWPIGTRMWNNLTWVCPRPTWADQSPMRALLMLAVAAETPIPMAEWAVLVAAVETPIPMAAPLEQVVAIRTIKVMATPMQTAREKAVVVMLVPMTRQHLLPS